MEYSPCMVRATARVALEATLSYITKDRTVSNHWYCGGTLLFNNLSTMPKMILRAIEMIAATMLFPFYSMS